MDKTQSQEIKMQIAQNIRRLRREVGMTQTEISVRSGIARPNIARIESGKHTPSIETLVAIANAMRSSLVQVLSGVQHG